MKVNIVSNDDWVIKRAIQELKKNPIFVQNEVKADFNYFFPYIKYRPTDITTVSLFTHYEQISEHDLANTAKKASRFVRIAKESDHCVSLSRQTKAILKVKAEVDSTVINFGTEFKKDIVFGVCGRTYKSGRKNEQFIKKLIELKYNVISWGDDNWGCPNLSTDFNDIEDFYSKIDYLIIPSSNEGGCMPMLEALAFGVPVIAPNVGWCWEYPCYHYDRDDFISLFKVILGLTTPPTWEQFVENHVIFFNSIYKK